MATVTRDKGGPQCPGVYSTGLLEDSFQPHLLVQFSAWAPEVSYVASGRAAVMGVLPSLTRPPPSDFNGACKIAFQPLLREN